MLYTAKNTWILRSPRLKKRAKRQASYRNISKLEFRNKGFYYKSRIAYLYMPLREFMFKLDLSEDQCKEIALYIRSLPPHELLFALRFAYSRYAAESGGCFLLGGGGRVEKKKKSLPRE